MLGQTKLWLSGVQVSKALSIILKFQQAASIPFRLQNTHCVCEFFPLPVIFSTKAVHTIGTIWRLYGLANRCPVHDLRPMPRNAWEQQTERQERELSLWQCLGAKWASAEGRATPTWWTDGTFLGKCNWTYITVVDLKSKSVSAFPNQGRGYRES